MVSICSSRGQLLSRGRSRYESIKGKSHVDLKATFKMCYKLSFH